MYEILSNKFDGERYGQWHENIAPDFTTDYFKFATVRNPYTRFASAWHYASKPDGAYKPIYEKLMGHEMELIYFLNWLIEERENLYKFRDGRGRLYQLSTILMPQHLNVEQRLNNMEIDRYIKLENLLDEFNDLPFVTPDNALPSIPKRHSGTADTHYKSWDELKTPEVISLVNEFVGKDFKTFSYAKESPHP